MLVCTMKKVNGFIALVLCCFLAQSQEADLILPEGHLEKISQIAYSPDGYYLVSASDDNTLKVWDVKTGRLLHDLTGHTDDILQFVFVDNGNKIRSLSRDKTVRTWNIKTGKEEFNCSGNQVVNTRAFLNEKGTLVATTNMNDGIARIWDISGKEWTLKHELSLDAESPLYLVAFSNDGKYICTNYADGKAAVWNLDKGQKQFVTKNKGVIYTASFSNDSQKLLTMVSDTLCIWNVENGKLVFESVKNNGYFSCATFSTNDSIIVAGNTRGELKIYDANSRKVLQKIAAHKNEISDIVVSSDNRFVYSVDYDGIVVKSELLTGKPICEFSTLYGSNSTMRFGLRLALSPNEKTLAVTNFAGTIEIWNIADERILHELKGLTCKIKQPVFSPDGSVVAVICSDYTVAVWDFRNASLKCTLKGHRSPVKSLNFTSDGTKIITSSEDGFVKVWNATTGLPMYSIEDLYSWVDEVMLSPNSKYMLIVPRFKNPRFYDINSGKLLFECLNETSNFRDAFFSEKDSLLNVIYRENDEIKLLKIDITQRLAIDDMLVSEIGNHEFTQQKSIYLLPDNSGLLYLDEMELHYQSFTHQDKHSVFDSHPIEMSKEPFTSDGKLIVFDTYAGTDELHAQVFDIATGSPVYDLTGYTFNPNGGIEQPFSNDGRWVLTMDDTGFVRVWNASDGKLKTEISCGDENNMLVFARFMPDNKTIMAGSLKVNEMQYIYEYNPVGIYDIETGTLIGTIPFEHGFPSAICDSENLAAYCYNSQLVLYDTRLLQEKAVYITLDNNEYMVVTPEKYYKCSKNAAGKILWRVEDTFYRFDQFDLQYNRPDKVLEKLGSQDSVLIKLYREAYLKRLKRSGFSENMFQPGWECPEVKIINSDEISWQTNEPVVHLNIKASDEKNKLDRIQVRVNEVPLYGSKGWNLKDLQSSSTEQQIDVNLSEGYNIIEVSCTNVLGVESFTESIEINYLPAVSPQSTLHLIVMSVSEYNDSRFNLVYPVKDGRDIVSLFNNCIPRLANNVLVDTLFNAMATRRNLLDLKSKLIATNIDDIVILYVSGHGLLGDDLNFYFATSDIDFGHPDKNGVSYDELEWMLDSIPARKKLILIDACHSGELDKEVLVENSDSIVLTDGTRGGLKTYFFKTAIMPAQSGNVSLNSAFELMKETFNDLSKGSGVVVISAAAGTGFAIESDEWNNGVFTYAIIDGLKNNFADLNQDATISISELKAFVSNEVEKLTQGRQKPSGRGETLLYDWKLLIKP